jgi:hypothetical protein
MRILKEAVPFDEILTCYEEENRGSEGHDVGLQYLHCANTRCKGRWTLASLSSGDIANVMLPWHRHDLEVIPWSGLSVPAAVQRLKQLPKEQMPKCWKRISGIGRRDFSQMHIALEIENGVLKHVDGVHRLLAYGLFEKDHDVLAYIARYPGMPASR